MEPHLVPGETADQGADSIWIAHVEVRVGLQRLHRLQRIRQRRQGLYREPFVQHQRVISPCVVECRQGVQPFRTVHAGQYPQSRQHVSHVLAGIELGLGEPNRRRVATRNQIAQARIPQAPAGRSPGHRCCIHWYQSNRRTALATAGPEPAQWPPAPCRARHGWRRRRRYPSCRRALLQRAAPTPRLRRPVPDPGWTRPPRSGPRRRQVSGRPGSRTPCPARRWRRTAGRIPSARTDRYHEQPGSAAGQGTGRTVSPGPRSPAAAMAPADWQHRRNQNDFPPVWPAERACPEPHPARLPTASQVPGHCRRAIRSRPG